MLFQGIKKYGDKIALISNQTGIITYNNIENQTDILKKKISSGSFAVLLCENSIAPIIYYIFSIKNNCPIMLVDIKTDLTQIKNIINVYKPSFIVGPNKWVEENNIDKHKIIYKILNYSIYKTKYNIFPKINDKLCLLMPTSGSMGSVKFVKISKENITENSNSIIKYLKITSKEKAITNMPFNYSYMLSVINTHIETGASIFVTNESIIQKKFWSDFKENKITSFNGVPYHYDILIKLGLKNIYHDNIKLFTQAGGKMNIKNQKITLDFCKKNKINFITMYGQTEASPRISYLKPKYNTIKIGSIGKPIPKCKMWIEDSKGKKISKINEIGELVVKGRNVCMGYAKNINDLKKPDNNNNLLKTGDLAFVDKDGFFYLTGRKSRIIKIFGKRLSLDEIEERMQKKGISIACKNKKEELYIYYENSQKKDLITKNITEITKQNIIDFKLVLIKKLPRKLNDKIDYQNLQ
jgi:long-subunit acyl-CoA synthetase (AMP-forming)